MPCNGGKRARNEQMDMFMKKFCAHGAVFPCPGVIYIYMTVIFKHL